MEYKQGLARRIAIAFMLMTIAVGGLLSAGIVGVVHTIEEYLISCDLGGRLGRILRDDLAQGHNPAPGPDVRFFISDGQGSYAMSLALDQLDIGLHEVFEGNLSFHAPVCGTDGRRPVLLQDQSDFETHEQVLYASVLIGYVPNIALASLLGWMLARRVMEPVVHLAHQVRHREQLLGLALPSVLDYANDEVGELAASFDETLGRPRDALKCKQLSTSDISHELRTPLMVIAISCGLPAERPGLGPHACGQLEQMTKATEEMHNLIQIFLLLAHVQEGEESLASHGSLGNIVGDLVRVWREQVEIRGLTLHYRDEGACAGQLNASLLHVMTGNLLRNTIHYTGAGSITLTFDGHDFSVKDTGAGVPEEQRERIFTPLVRGSSNSGRGEGFGLGLLLVERIYATEGQSVTLGAVEPHGYRLEILPDVAWRKVHHPLARTRRLGSYCSSHGSWSSRHE